MERTALLEGLRQLIHTLVEGFTTLNRRLWVLAVPIGLDLFLWVGPWVSLQELTNALAAFLRGIGPVDPEQAAQVAVIVETWGKETNLTHLLSGPIIPALVPGLPLPALPGWYVQPHWIPAAGWLLSLMPLVGFALVLLLWSLYLVPLADLVRGSGERGIDMLRRIPVVWWRMAVLLGMALLAGIVYCFLCVALISIGMLIHSGLALLIFWICFVLALWVILYLYLTPNVILLSGVNPWRAILYSVQIVRFKVWSTVGFVVLTYIIRIGTVSLWQRLAGHPLGILVGILANAYIVGGLLAAGLVFYRDRLQEWLKGEQDGQDERPVL